jgi:hypothetical protein
MCKRGFIVKRKVKPYFVFVEVFVESRGFEQSTHTKSNQTHSSTKRLIFGFCYKFFALRLPSRAD